MEHGQDLTIMQNLIIHKNTKIIFFQKIYTIHTLINKNISKQLKYFFLKNKTFIFQKKMP